jgi:hypothetical protein
MQTILGISGPPRAGKDTTAAIIAELLPGTALRRLSSPLKEIARLYIPMANRRDLEENKDEALNSIGTTYRDLQIGAWILGRDLMGEDWLGYALCDSIHYCHSPLILVPDFGRLSEALVLTHTGHRILQLKIQRPGTTFTGDSREDFTIPGPSNSTTLINSGSLAELRRNIIEEIMPWIASARKIAPSRHNEAEAQHSEEPVTTT